MKPEKAKIAAEPAEKALVKPNEAAPAKQSPVFVEAEKLFEKMTEITREITARAFDLFRSRGGEIGKELEDWFRAEGEVLRPTLVEIRESPENIFVTAAVPGFKPDEIEVSIKGKELIISGNSEAQSEKEEANLIRSEWHSNKFFRRLELPAPVIEANVGARLKDGMLELTLPKSAEHEATKVSVAAG